jgi:peptidoglycan/LPS O-acetylase OafA/YrhL
VFVHLGQENPLSSPSAPTRARPVRGDGTGASAARPRRHGVWSRLTSRVADVLSPAEALPRQPHRHDLQGLRGVAVLLVVLCHAGVPGLRGGYIGVDVFLVLSGYLITSLLLHEATSTGSVSLVAFYARRARRILPAATLTLVATALIATLTLPYTRADQVVQDVLWATFFAANVHAAAVGTDYFTAGQPPSPVQHFWSLAVEEQFYLVWPAVLVLVLAVGIRKHRAGAEGARRRLPLLALLVAAACALSYMWAETGVVSDPTAIYFSTSARVWELGAGALLAMAGSVPARLPFVLRALLAWAGLVAVLVAAVTFHDTTAIPGSAALLPVLGTVALLAAGTAGALPGASRLMAGRRLGWLGDVSYGFYLWHWPALVLPAAYVGHELGLLANLGLLVVALGVSALSSRLLENPVRRVEALGRRPDLALSLWPLAVTAVLSTALWCGGQIAVAAAGGTAPAAAATVPEYSMLARGATTGSQFGTGVKAGPDAATAAQIAAARSAVEAAADPAVAGEPVPATSQDLRTLAMDKWDREMRCVASDDQTSAQLCPVGDPDADRTIVLLGDSHAGMWLPALEKLGLEQGWRVVPLIKFGCPAVDWPVWQASEGQVNASCTEFHDWAVAQVADLDPDLVVVGSRAVSSFANEERTGPLDPGDGPEAWETGVRGVLDELAAHTDQVSLVLDTPTTPQPPADCLSDAGATVGSCTTQMPAEVTELNARTRAAASAAGAQVIDMEPYVCAQGRCPMVVGSTAVYSDEDHLSATYVKQVTAAFVEQLQLSY